MKHRIIDLLHGFLFQLLTSLGYHVITIDYRGKANEMSFIKILVHRGSQTITFAVIFSSSGFGDSEGKPSENGKLIHDSEN